MIRKILAMLCALFIGVALMSVAGCGGKKEEAQTEEALPDLSMEDELGLDESDTSGGDMSLEGMEEEFKSEEPASPEFSGEFAEDGRYVVQVAAGPSASMAKSLADQLNSQGYPAYVAEVENPSHEAQGLYHRVRVGGFHGKSIAESFGNTVLADLGHSWWVDNKSNDNVGMGSMGSSSDAESFGESSSDGMAEDNSWGGGAEASSSFESQEPAAATPEPEAQTPPPAAEAPAAEPAAPAPPPPAAEPAPPAPEAPADDWGSDW